MDHNIVHMKFKKFSESWDFIHKTSSPEFPPNNGFVEGAIQTIKKTLQKCKRDNSDPYYTQPKIALVYPP